MKNYTVSLEVVVAVLVDVEADSKKEAEKIAKQQIQTMSDIRNAWFVSKSVEDVEEIKED